MGTPSETGGTTLVDCSRVFSAPSIFLAPSNCRSRAAALAASASAAFATESRPAFAVDFDAALSVALDVVSDEERSPVLKPPVPGATGAVSRAGIEGGRPDERNPWLGRSAAVLCTTGGLAFSGKLFGEDSGLGFSGLVFSVLLLCAVVDPLFGPAGESLV